MWRLQLPEASKQVLHTGKKFSFLSSSGFVYGFSKSKCNNLTDKSKIWGKQYCTQNKFVFFKYQSKIQENFSVRKIRRIIKLNSPEKNETNYTIIHHFKNLNWTKLKRFQPLWIEEMRRQKPYSLKFCSLDTLCWFWERCLYFLFLV